MPQEQPLIEKSYKRLKQKYNMPAYDDYVKLLETPEGRQKAYNRLSQKYRMPIDFQTFDSDIKKQLPRSAIGQFAEGFKRSNIGLAFEGVQAIPTGGAPIFAPIPRTKVPEVKEPNTFAQSLATQAGTLVGDFPAMMLGSVLALPSKNPAAIAGASFAAPEAIRQAQLEFLEKGTDRPFFTTKDVSELAGRMVAMRNLQPVPEYNPESVVGSLLKAGVAGAKGFAIGAATAKAGQLAPAGFKTAAEIGTLATLPHAIEGELPSVQSVAEAAVLVGGLKLAARGAKQIAKVAKRRGQTVEEVVSEIKDEADPQKALDAIEKATEKTERVSSPKPAEPIPTTHTATSYSRQFNDAVETAKNTLLVTRGLGESVRKQRLQEALKDYDPIVAEEILQPRRESGGAIAREERAEVSVEPSAEQKPLVDAIAEASVRTSNLRAQLDAIKAELTKRLEASGLTEAQVPTSEGKTIPLSIKQQPKLSPEQQAIVQEAINKAAEEGGFSVESIGRGLEIIATPEKLPAFDFSQTPIEQLVQMVEPTKTQLKAQLDNLKITKVVGKDALTDYFFETKAKGESAAPLKGTSLSGEAVAIKVNRARSASRPDLEPWKQYVEEIEARERKLASETEGTLVIGKPQEPTVGNTLFTQEAYNDAIARMRRVGITPKPEENLRDAITVGGYYFEKGLKEFQQWSESVVRDLGENIRPQLPAVWNTLHTIQQSFFQKPEKTAPEGRVYHGSNSSIIAGITEIGGFSSEVKYGARHNTTKSFNFAFGYGKDKALKTDGIVNIVETPDRHGIIPLNEIIIHEFNRDGEYIKSYSMASFEKQPSSLVIGKPQERTVGNTLFTQESYEAALKRLREDVGKMYDITGAMADLPRQLKDWTIVGGYHFEKGIREFGAWSSRMIEEFGESVRQQLPAIWNTIHTIYAVGELKSAKHLLDAIERGQVAKTSKGIEEVSTSKKELLGTKVLNEKGEPQRVYHGTKAVFEEFDPKFQDSDALYGRGFYFTESPKVASGYTTTKDAPFDAKQTAPNVKMAYLRIKKPFDLDKMHSLAGLSEETQAFLKSAGIKEKQLPGYEIYNLYDTYSSSPYAAIKTAKGTVYVGRSTSHAELANSFGISNSELALSTKGWSYGDEFMTELPQRAGTFRDFLKQNGFDGITHVGGRVTGGEPHKVWIALDADQIVYPDEFVKPKIRGQKFEQELTETQPKLSQSVLDFLSESIKGITELAGGKRLGIQPYSQANYNAALPHFRAAWKAYKTAGKKFSEFQRDMREKFGQNIDLYLAQYRKEIDASDFVRILSEATLPDENFVQLDASLPAIWILSPEQSARTAGKGLINSTGRKAPVEVNLETPGIQDVTSFIIGSEGRALEVITRDVSHINRVRREAFAETANVSSKTIIDPGRPFLGAVTRKRFEKTDAEIVKAAKEYYLTGKSPKGVSKAVFNAAEEVELFLRLLDDYTTDYAKTLAQLGEKPAAVKKAIAKLTKLRNKALGGKNPKDFWNDLELYISAHAKTTIIDPVAKAVKRYINQAGEGAFPENVKKLIYDQIIDAKGRVWLGDRMADSILQWFAQSKVAKKVGVNIEPSAKPFTRAVGGARSGQAKLKLGYRPIAAAINGVYAFYKPLVKADGPMMKAAQEALKFMNSPEGKTLLEEETYHGSLGISVATDTSGKPIPKESLLSPLGLWMAVEAPARRFNFSVSYLDALKRGMPEAAAKEFARRMVRLTNLTYVMSATPRIMRSPSARLVTQFKRFLSGEAEFMHTLSPREWARYALFQSLVVGPRGAIFFIKSIPVLAEIGILDEVEEQINKLGAIASGLPGLLFGVDLGPAATLQLPTRPEDAYGVIISDAIKFYKEVYSPALNPELSAEGKLKNAAERIPEFAIAAKNWMDLVESNVNEDGWVLDSEGNPQYRLDSDYEKFLVGVLGATTLEKSRIQTAQSLAIREDKRKDEALKILSRRLRKEFALMGTISDSLIDDMIKVGVSDASSIENILESSKLPPEVRIALRARLKDRGKVFELFRE